MLNVTQLYIKNPTYATMAPTSEQQ